MNQDQIFFESEGDNWFARNKPVLELVSDRVDLPSYLIEILEEKSNIKSVLELGCANGWRLNSLKQKLLERCRFVGVDASIKAIQDGRARYPFIELHQGLLSKVPVVGQFDLVIVYFVLHWVDRTSLTRSVSEIDRLISDDGFLVLGDFLPDSPQRRCYHHLPNENVYTYKQDYAKIFESYGLYKEVARIAFDHDRPATMIQTSDSSSRCVCTVLKKSVENYYMEVV